MEFELIWKIAGSARKGKRRPGNRHKATKAQKIQKTDPPHRQPYSDFTQFSSFSRLFCFLVVSAILSSEEIKFVCFSDNETVANGP